MRAKFKTLATPSVIAVFRLMRDKRERTILEISDAVHLSVPTVQCAMNALEHHGEAHLCGYREAPRHISPVWVIGPGERAPLPPKQTREERCAQMKAYRERTGRQSRAYEATPFRDPFVAAFFGDAPPLAQMAKLTRHIIKQSMEIEDEMEAA